MSKIQLSGRLQQDRIQGTWEESRDSVISALGELQDSVVSVVNGNITARDNTPSDYADYLLTHGAQVRIKNPLRRGDRTRQVLGIHAERCVGVEMSGGKPTRKLYALGNPRIDWQPADSAADQLLVTAYFPAPLGICAVSRGTDQSINSGGATTSVQFSAADIEVGAASWDETANTRITLAAAGIVNITGQASWDTAAGGYRIVGITKNGSGHYAEQVIPGGTYVTECGSDKLAVVSGDYLEMAVFQNSGAPLNLLTAGRIAMSAEYVSPPVGTTGKVTLFFFGG